MKYYIFKTAVNNLETGSVYPQIQKMSPGYNYKAPYSVYALSKEYQHLPDFIPDLDYFELAGKAKLSDLLSTAMAYGGFLISEKLKNVFEKFTLPMHRFYSARVKYKNQFYNYYWMHIICDLTNAVDYKNSKFFIYHNYAHNLGYIDISSKAELEEKQKKLKADNPGKTITIWVEKIIFNNAFNEKIDLFKIGQFDSNYYISEQLKKAIIGASITGVNMQKAENITTK